MENLGGLHFLLYILERFQRNDKPYGCAFGDRDPSTRCQCRIHHLFLFHLRRNDKLMIYIPIDYSWILDRLISGQDVSDPISLHERQVGARPLSS